MHSTENGLYKLDFDEARNIAALVGFDVMRGAKKLRSCGPGCDYFSKEKKYFITMLLQHVRALPREQPLATEVQEWLVRASAAEEESMRMEKAHVHVRLGKRELSNE